MPQSYPFFHAAGSPVDLGRQHGEQAREHIRSFLDYLTVQLKVSRELLRDRARRFLPLFESHCSHLLPEITGLAKGADIDFLDALAVQLRGELGQIGDGACTSFVIGREGTAAGSILIGQTSDNPAALMDFAYVLDLKPATGPRMLMWTFGGMLGYHGLNDRGVAHFANALGGGPAWKFALSHYPLKRLILESNSLAEILALMRRVKVCSNGNYVLCDGDGRMLDVELTSDGPEELAPTRNGVAVHANHFLCSSHALTENHAQSLPDSFCRQNRMTQLIEGKFGSLTVDDLKAFVSDHENHPTGICRHPHEGPDHPMLDKTSCTVAALIAEPARGKLHVSYGNPCENRFVEYTF